MGFEKTTTGYRADDEQIAYWRSRDICPDCGEVVTPKDRISDGRWRYICQSGEVDVEWTTYSPTDCT